MTNKIESENKLVENLKGNFSSMYLGQNRTLGDFILNEGVEGNVFYGIVGGRKREYSPVGVDYKSVDKNPEIIGLGMLVNLVGTENIPKKIIKRREQFRVVGMTKRPYFDYLVDPSNHLFDKYVRELEEHEIVTGNQITIDEFLKLTKN